MYRPVRVSPYSPTGRIATFVVAIQFGLLVPSFARPVRGQDRIILRSQETLTPRSIGRIDAEGVLLGDGQLVTWDRIESGVLAGGRQEAFDRLLAELGTPLYRIRQRLATGDDEGILEYAEAVYPRYGRSHSATAYMVFQGLMWSRIAAGRREAAVGPYLECLDYLRHAGDATLLPGNRRLAFEPESGISGELLPVWFDAEAARRALPEVLDVVRRMRQPKPEGARIYYATLALAAGDDSAADQALDGLERLDAWRRLIDVEQDVRAGRRGPAAAELERDLPQLPVGIRAPALYWLGRARLLDADRRAREIGLLHLLTIPALEGQRQAELSAAGLYHAIEVLDEFGDARGAIAVRRELLERYGGTLHAARLKLPNASPDTDR